MSKPKFIKGRIIRNIADYEESRMQGCMYYKMLFNGHVSSQQDIDKCLRTRHHGFVGSLQYSTLRDFINNERVYEAVLGFKLGCRIRTIDDFVHYCDRHNKYYIVGDKKGNYDFSKFMDDIQYIHFLNFKNEKDLKEKLENNYISPLIPIYKEE